MSWYSTIGSVNRLDRFGQMPGMTDSPTQPVAALSPFDTLRDKHGLKLPNIDKARIAADATTSLLRTTLNSIDLPDTTALVVFGSLARREWTSDSDVDWTLLVNGPSDPEHFRLAVLIGE